LLLYMCTIQYHILIGHLHTQHVYVVVLTNYVVDLTIFSRYVVSNPHHSLGDNSGNARNRPRASKGLSWPLANVAISILSTK
jgi:hypothetical protein